MKSPAKSVQASAQAQPNSDGSNEHPESLDPDRHAGHGKKDFFFRNIPKLQRGRLRMDDEAIYSISDCDSANKMSQLALSLPGVSRSSTVTDFTACVGGNVISFSSHFQKVNAVENDLERFEMLKFNVSEVLGRTNVEFWNSDAVQLISSAAVRQDVAFFDPPW
jgi:predicted RNA methylase